jgi:hypothetical protein
MSSFFVRARLSAFPIERVTLADGTTLKDNIHSDIDKGLSGSEDSEAVSTAEQVAIVEDYTPVSGGENMQTIFSATSMDSNDTPIMLIAVGKEKVGTGGCWLDFGSETRISELTEVGEFIYISNPNITANTLKLSSSGAVNYTKVDILIAWGIVA